MSPSIKFSAAVAAAVTCLTVAATAQAGGYAGNGCVAKKQAAVGKYAVSVGKAYDKYAAGPDRDEAITKAATKLSDTWTKEEAKAVKKNASCNESTDTAAALAAIVDAAVAAVAADNFLALAGYTGDAMKAWGKHIKDPVKDLGKTTLTAALAAATTEHLTGATMLVTNTANALIADIVEATTTAPNYPDTFQTIVPGGSVIYGKEELSPRCVDNTPYMYFAKKGNSNNVLMYYQGGGACWNDASCNTLGTCSRTAEANDNPALTTTGFANYNDPANPFYDWNVVFVTYCTCDIHWGEAITNYPGGVAYHRGRVNAAVAEKFAREHFLDPERVFVTGSSAGSYGAIMNSYFLMRNVWPNADYSVMGDAGVGVITKQWLDSYIKNWGLEENFPTDLPGVELPVENLSLVDLIDGLSQRFPNARLANYDSSYDGGDGSQTQFFQVMRHPVEHGGDILTDWGAYWQSACDWNACMREFKADNAAKSTKYKYFTGAGSRHTIFGSDKVYKETKSRDADGNGVTFAAWVQSMINNDAGFENVDCNNPGGDCNLTNSCQGGMNYGEPCSTNLDCPGGTCQHDPDSANAPYANNDTVTCAPTTCPCEGAGRCYDGPNEGSSCTTNTDCGPSPNLCAWVNCSQIAP